MSPFAPHLAGRALGTAEIPPAGSLITPWPLWDPACVAEDEIEMPVQVNGKLREPNSGAQGCDGRRDRSSRASQSKSKRSPRGQDCAQKVVVVPRKLVNVVAA
jgi:leucyl-tRNA synthetase